MLRSQTFTFKLLIFFSFSVGGYRIVYKKVPQFIVPDLTGFEVPKKQTNKPRALLLFTKVFGSLGLNRPQEYVGRCLHLLDKI